MAKTVFLMLCLIVGNLIGAGILALPINAGFCGFVPSLIAMLIFGGAMFFSAWVLGREATDEKLDTFNYPSLYRRYAGPVGMWVATIATLVILYGLLTAYLTGATKILSDLLGVPASAHGLVMLGFFVVVAGFTSLPLRMMLALTALLVVVKLATFCGMTGLAEGYVQPDRLTRADWAFLPASSAIILTAFHFHNIIPNICRELKWNFGHVWKTILGGMIAGYLINATWIQVSIGVIPMDDSPNGLLTAFAKNLPATVPMSHLVPSHAFVAGATLFAIAAIMTAFMSNGLGLRSFMRDLLVNQCRIQVRGLDSVLTFVPPLLVGYFYPDIFLKAIDVVGGVGIVTLFGILPSIIFIRKAATWRTRALGWAVMALFAACLVIEICQETGLLSLRSDVEYWNEPATHSEHYAPPAGPDVGER